MLFVRLGLNIKAELRIIQLTSIGVHCFIFCYRPCAGVHVRQTVLQNAVPRREEGRPVRGRNVSTVPLLHVRFRTSLNDLTAFGCVTVTQPSPPHPIANPAAAVVLVTVELS